MRVLTAIVSSGRPHLLRLTTQWLFPLETPCHAAVFDDHPDSMASGVIDFLRMRGILLDQADGGPPPRALRERASRCAAQRRRAVDWFLAEAGRGDILFLKDDDILMPMSALTEAVEDLAFLNGTDYGANVAALTLHGFAGHTGGYIPSKGGKVFTRLRLSGEANVLLRYDALRESGNRFDPAHEKGFADLQWQSFSAHGYSYMTRVWPPYEVQHLGFGPNGSRIHADEGHTPRWCAGPYETYYLRRPKEVVPIQGFPLEQFVQAAKVLGGEEAARQWLQEQNEVNDAKLNK